MRRIPTTSKSCAAETLALNGSVRLRTSSSAVLAALLCGLTVASARGQDAGGFSQPVGDPAYANPPTYLVEMKDGNLLPPELVVPAKKRFRLLVRNVGGKPAEFESNQLRQEEVLFTGADTTVLITPLDPGSYDYFDDFAPTMTGKITAR